MFFLKSKEPVSPEEVEREKQRKSEEFERRKQDLLRRLASIEEQFENGAITVEQMELYLQVMEEILIYGKTKKEMRMEVIEVVVCCFFFVLGCALARILKDPDHNMARTVAHWQESIKESIEVAIAYYPVKLVEQTGLFVVQHQSA